MRLFLKTFFLLRKKFTHTQTLTHTIKYYFGISKQFPELDKQALSDSCAMCRFL